MVSFGVLLVVGCSGGGSSSDDGGGGTGGSVGSTTSTGGTGGTAGATSSGGTGGTTSVGGVGGSGGSGGSTSVGGAGGTGGSTSAGGSGGAGGSSSTGGAGGATLTLPVMRAGVYTLEFGTTKFTVDPAPGGRIVEYSLDGKNVLTDATANASYWGSTFWTAPEGQWMGSAQAKGGANMMLVPAFDTMTYPMTVADDDSFSGTGPTVAFANMTFTVTKKFAANLAAGAIDIVYSITNTGTASMTTGHWEVTRVYPNGLTFFPAPPAASSAPLYGPPTSSPIKACVSVVNGVVWLDHTKYVPGTPATYGKYSTDASGGWVAHVVPDTTGAGDIMLIKTFKDIPDKTAGTGHGEVEVYYREDRSYEEVEDHHEQATFAPGQKIDWPVRWYLRRIPKTITRTVGNQMLVDFAEAQIK